jgi:putative hydrolase of the HAD superfamily
MPEAVIFFDVDGTLVDHDGAASAAVGSLQDRFSHLFGHFDRSELVNAWLAFERRWFDLYLAGEISHQAQRRCRIADLWSFAGAGAIEVELADEAFAAYLRAYEDNWRAFGDVAPALSHLRGRRVGVLTTATPSSSATSSNGSASKVPSTHSSPLCCWLCKA